MQEQNICRFISESESSDLKTVNFVFERDPEVQQTDTALKNDTVYLIAEGEGTLSFDREPISVRRGDLIFGFSGERFFARGAGLTYFYIGFTGGRAQKLYYRFGVTSASRKFSGHEGSLPFWQESISRATDENIDIISESVLTYAFSKLTSVREQNEDLAYRMIRYAEKNFSDPSLSLASLAGEWGYNSKYLSDSFKKRTGVGFSRHLKALRIKHAVFLMDHGVESVKNVAFLCGFQDPLYFSKVFRQTVGTSPSEYLQNKNGQPAD